MKETNYPARPDITKIDFNGLPRKERIYQSIMHPRYFQLSDQDERYFNLMRMCYNTLLEASTDIQARRIIKSLEAGRTMSTAEVIELIRDTKEFFGNINGSVREEGFERMRLRHRLEEYIERCKAAGDLKNERIAYVQLEKLDEKEFRSKLKDEPEVAVLPNIRYFSDAEDATIVDDTEEPDHGEEE